MPYPEGTVGPGPGGLPIMPYPEGTVGPAPGGSPIIPKRGIVADPSTTPAGQRVIQDPATIMRRLDTRQLEQIQMQQPMRR